ncbi:MAG: Lrp/AsnC family transcriptional regulator [Porticoccaceae bacterium]|jgi:Lrp/AsnC family transcriptional regulator, leucine-responsive regulatory protein|nr:Lrp/AsnC family transcriptional regulator [Porticoccaceae bacterium]
MKLDKTDKLILSELQKNGRLANSELAKRVNLSESACLRRVKLMEENGVIERYAMIVNQEKVGKPGNVFIEITLESQQQADLNAFEQAVREVPEVMECYLMTGDYDYLLRVVIAGTADYERIHHDYLTQLPKVARVRSSIALRAVAKRTSIPIP